MTAEKEGHLDGVPWKSVKTANVTAYLDTENVFYWSHPSATESLVRSSRRADALHEMSLAETGKKLRGDRSQITAMARGAAVFELLNRWLASRGSGVYDLRSYGKTADPAVTVIAEAIAAREKARPATPGDWTHVGVGQGKNLADLEIAKDLSDRSMRPQTQSFYILSSDVGETLGWAQAIAIQHPHHDFKVVLGPTVVRPALFEPDGALSALDYVGAVSELYAQAVREEQRGARLPEAKLARSAYEHAWRYARQNLTDGRVQSRLARTKTAREFIDQLLARTYHLASLTALSAAERSDLAARWPEAVLAAWRQGPAPKTDPAYALAENVGSIINRASGHSALEILGRVVRHALNASDGDWANEARKTLDVAEEKKRSKLGPARHDI